MTEEYDQNGAGTDECGDTLNVPQVIVVGGDDESDDDVDTG